MAPARACRTTGPDRGGTVPRCGGRVAELLGRPGQPEERERPGFIQADAGQPGPVAAVEAVPAGLASDRPYGDAGRGERLHVALHGALADLQLAGQIPAADLAVDLKLQQQGHHP
jgi:hypothetical protein